MPWSVLNPELSPHTDYLTNFVPVTQSGSTGHGPNNQQLFLTENDPIDPSLSQGIGRSPGQRWAHWPLVQQFNFDAESHIAYYTADPIPRDEQQGWLGKNTTAAGYYEQSPSQQFVWPDPITIEDPYSQSYTNLAQVPA